MSGVPKKTGGLDPGSLHRFTFVFPVPAVPEHALPWRELEIENVEAVSGTPLVTLQSPDMVRGESESNVAILVEGAVGMAQSMGTSLLQRYDTLNVYSM